jgi:DNA topoisomerase-1
LEAYCLKCRSKQEMQNPVPIWMKNGKPATEGTCPVSGNKMFKIGMTPAHESLPKPV